jgi:hypothetical protein
MIERIKKLYKRYMKAAKENDFSFKEYGFLGERLDKQKDKD